MKAQSLQQLNEISFLLYLAVFKSKCKLSSDAFESLLTTWNYLFTSFHPSIHPVHSRWRMYSNAKRVYLHLYVVTGLRFYEIASERKAKKKSQLLAYAVHLGNSIIYSLYNF